MYDNTRDEIDSRNFLFKKTKAVDTGTVVATTVGLSSTVLGSIPGVSTTHIITDGLVRIDSLTVVGARPSTPFFQAINILYVSRFPAMCLACIDIIFTVS